MASRSQPDRQLPEQARAVVIGGGIIGCSVAYHLADLGLSDVVLLERDRLTSGSTWHAAGLIVTFGSLSATSTEMRLYTRELYGRLEEETGQATGFDPIGFIELAATDDRLEEYRRVAAFNRHLGVNVHEISPAEVGRLFPAARTDDIRAGFYVPEDGKANPADVTMALARGARMRGATIVEGVSVTGVTTRGGAVSGVQTTSGEITAEYVVNCAGMWARQLAEVNGVTVPLQAAEHYYLLTEPISGVSPSWPVIEDPASYGYYRPEGGGLMIGLFEPVCAPWRVDGVPDDASFLDLPPDWDRMAPYVETAMSRVPVTSDVGIKKLFCGPESFTPDLQSIVGEAPEVRNYFVAAGLNSIGILTGGGMGRAVAQWIVGGRPDIDVTALNIDRLHPYQATPEYRRTRTVESLGLVYAAHYPHREMATARGARLSPLHARLEAQRAHFRDVSGWEAADWFAPPGIEPEVGELSWGRHSWFPYWEAEHHQVRRGVAAIDMSFMAKFWVRGPDAGQLLERLSAGTVADTVGRITYTPWLNEAGVIEADLTVTNVDGERFLVVATDTAHRHVATWMRRHVAADADVAISDVTGGLAMISVQGPRARDVLEAATSADMSAEAFPFRAAREIDVGYARALCIRITYVGELGYELYVAAEQAGHVWDVLFAAGAEFGLRPAGLKALGSLRMEKAYRDYGHDIDNTDNPWEAGLGFAVDLDKPFLGRDTAAAHRTTTAPPHRLVQILVTDPKPLLYHGEVVHRDGVACGYIRSASYGHTVGGAVGLAMIAAGGDPVTADWIAAGSWEVDIAGTRYPAQAALRPLYDPAANRIHS